MQNKYWIDNKAAYYNYDRSIMHPLIPEGPNVILDLGCAAGQLGRKLKELNKASILIGVEIFQQAAEEAEKYYDKVYCDDVETVKLPYHGYFDIVICGDILEHLRDPWKMADRIHGLLKSSGILISSIPNIRYWRILRDIMIFGNWQYTEAGILDNTHLRFFTRRSFIHLLRNAKFEIMKHEMVIGGPKQNLFNKISLSLFEEFMGSQFIVVAKKSDF